MRAKTRTSENGTSALPHVVVLGAGPAGTYGAYQLAMQGRARCTVIEQGAATGGNAGSFKYKGQFLDYGSHRLHQATQSVFLQEIQCLLGSDLRLRPRRGRIRLRGRWLKFPLKPVDLLMRLDRPFALLVLRDMVFKSTFGAAHAASHDETFASVLSSQLGPSICKKFYFPYSRKLWGCEPEELSAVQARRRVSANSFGRLLAKVVSNGNGGAYYYPKRGFGQITDAFENAARQRGVEFRMGRRVSGLARNEQTGGWRVSSEYASGVEILEADYVWSTLPLGPVIQLLRPSVPDAVIAATAKLESRAMILAYLELPIDQFSTTDAHYFPELSVRMSRLSEPKNYFGGLAGSGRTVLCAEIPCARDEPIWTQSDAEIGALLEEEMTRVGLPLGCRPVACFTRRLTHAYPVYKRGYESALATLDDWAWGLPNFITYGRQGLFAHDNTHHAFEMARAAVSCLGNDGFDMPRWRRYRATFESHVVED